MKKKNKKLKDFEAHLRNSVLSPEPAEPTKKRRNVNMFRLNKKKNKKTKNFEDYLRNSVLSPRTRRTYKNKIET
jgi:hypothetical protein